jgi:pSer/pThr/pTyr-binding forkhead associated (FHA) protein
LKSGSTVSVTDHGSTNGSWVNGMKVGGTVSLNPGDQVRFGSIEYQYEG